MLGAARRDHRRQFVDGFHRIVAGRGGAEQFAAVAEPGLGGCPPGKGGMRIGSSAAGGNALPQAPGADIAFALNNSAMPMQGSAVILIACFIELASFAGFDYATPPPAHEKAAFATFSPATFCLHPASNVMKGKGGVKGRRVTYRSSACYSWSSGCGSPGYGWRTACPAFDVVAPVAVQLAGDAEPVISCAPAASMRPVPTDASTH